MVTQGWFDLRPIVDRLPWPDVRGKNVFGHRGWVRAGTMLGFIADEGIAVKALSDAHADGLYSRPGARPFVYGGSIRPGKERRDVISVFEAVGARAANRITDAQLKEVEDREIERVIKKQEEVGLQAVTDGEFRRSWWHFDFLAYTGAFAGIERGEDLDRRRLRAAREVSDLKRQRLRRICKRPLKILVNFLAVFKI